jgi:hypothetical protein
MIHGSDCIGALVGIVISLFGIWIHKWSMDNGIHIILVFKGIALK